LDDEKGFGEDEEGMKIVLLLGFWIWMWRY